MLCSRVSEAFGDNVAYFDAANKLPHKLRIAPQGFPVVRDSGWPTSLEEESALIDRLEELKVRRILAPKELVPKIREFCERQKLNVN